MKAHTQKRKPSVKINDWFWNKRIEVINEEVIPYQWKALNDELPNTDPSHAIENFKIASGETKGEYYGMVFQDSDVAKWLEAVAYSLENKANPELEKLADSVIELIGRAQQSDGYLNTYYTIKEPDKRWTNLRDNHELYCAGHLIEAAVAYYEATGKRQFLEIMSRYADYIGSVFGTEEGKIPGYPGHQEIELALVRLYQTTGKENYLKLSQYFIDQRGTDPNYFRVEAEKRGDTEPFWWNDDLGYHQAHLPVRQQTKAVGHAVRAVYMYTAMADLAAETGDPALIDACETLWNNVTRQQMYITAGIGPSEFGEAFSFDYDLPNDTAYTETCASIGLVFWANRMQRLQKKAEYADVIERALYNGTISGMDLDGKKFFYVNPLEVTPEVAERRHDYRHVKPVRQKWFKCACCPPNIARLVASLNHYIYAQENNELYVHLYIGSNGSFSIDGQAVSIQQTTNYPWDGTVDLTVTPDESKEFTIALRIPGWAREAFVSVNGEKVNIDILNKDGYVYIKRIWQKNDTIQLVLPMAIERIQTNPKVRENAGKIALVRGPIVYCLEEVDNGKDLQLLSIPTHASLSTTFEPNLLDGVTVINGEAVRMNEDNWKDVLYRPWTDSSSKVTFKAIPYFAWCNREPGEMRVWLNETKE
ncbi:glycoside hydrolase family 127 protein [Bacillus solitudinis]|uniref:glycoside hydrolase family 127 protein n=1 Tax=Bacillus solitudinis TaxID=2014074 RepID=UPI000C24F5B8|nr:beta-L-arabinofuranosidase domain-containing protein [Bacillus solitudinis]